MGCSCRQQFTAAARDLAGAVAQRNCARSDRSQQESQSHFFNGSILRGSVGCLLPPRVATGLGAAGLRGAVAGRIPLSQLGTQEKATMATTPLSVNGRTVSVTVDEPDTPLLYVLRNELRLHGPRFGCGLGQCGACTVHVDGEAVRSCMTPLSAVTAEQKGGTLEGLGTTEKLHPIQQAFIDEQAGQCGYC